MIGFICAKQKYRPHKKFDAEYMPMLHVFMNSFKEVLRDIAASPSNSFRPIRFSRADELFFIFC